MAAGAILRLQKLKGDGKIRAAAAHNQRTIQAELGAGSHIDARRTDLNAHLAGPASPAAVAKLADDRMKAAGVGKLRKDVIRAIESVVSLPVNAVADDSTFFNDAMMWLAGRFGGSANILSADIHRDESVPHMHLLLLPLFGGNMVGSDAIGGPGQLRALQDDFYREVCQFHGLTRYPRQLQGAVKSDAAAAVIRELQGRGDPSLRGVIWPLIRDRIVADPGPFAVLLGIDVAVSSKKKRQRTMAEIFTSPGKGPRWEPEAKPYRVRIASVGVRGDRTLCSVGFASAAVLPTHSGAAKRNRRAGVAGLPEAAA